MRWSDPKNQSDAELTAEKILRELALPFPLKGEFLQFTGSIGISFYPEHGGDDESMLRAADYAMYLAKRQGKDRYLVFSKTCTQRGQEK